jgi:hypothetical protein
MPVDTSRRGASAERHSIEPFWRKLCAKSAQPGELRNPSLHISGVARLASGLHKLHAIRKYVAAQRGTIGLLEITCIFLDCHPS